ncbi:S41 family peptidase [Mammaliicoccus lentus]|jgi:hypothetical protein|uniref:S41 family peptidase n=1 Tax=Mammaliicoccus lentus TaxID=42858 RepID=UPI0035111FB8
MYNQEMTTIKNQLLNEYAGYLDKTKLIQNFPIFSSFKDNEDFYFSMTSYLNEFYDPHLKIIDKKEPYPNIRVQLYEDKLYVIESKNSDLKKGTIIERIGDLSIKEILFSNSDLLKSDNPERMEWTDVLKKYKYIKHNSKVINILSEERINFFESYYTIEESRNYLYIRLTDFMDTYTITNLINSHKQVILDSKNIIIDLRGNRGGSDFAQFALLPLLTNNNISTQYDYPYYHRFTKSYCDNRLFELNKMLEQQPSLKDNDEFNQFLNLFTKYYDKGLVNINIHNDNEYIHGLRGDLPSLKILCDFECASSGEGFVLRLKDFKNAEIIGRPTKGMNDYSNVMIVDINNDYQLMVPHSKDGAVDVNKGMSNKGVEVDYYIPWTPEELHKDIILETAIERFKSS